jgi:hypothetical protein
MKGHWRRIMESMVTSLRDKWTRTAQDHAALRDMRDWYRRWVRVRELRYQYLADILDDVDAFRAEAQRQAGSDDPSSAAGNSQRIGVPSIDAGGDNRRASPHGVGSTSAARSPSVSRATEDELG